MYDNVFSIMGKRGAGKTSVLFTLKNKLQKEHPKDLMLPIIMPEIIPEGQGMIGWILSVLDSEVAHLEKELESRGTHKGLFANCSYENENSLSKQLRHVKDLYYSQDYNIEEVRNFSAAIANSNLRTQNSFDFGKEMTVFWKELVKTIKKVKNMNSSEEPLIHIFFDDVDLRPQTLMSLFSTIMKYLSYPNLMVYVTADEDQLYDIIESTMNSRMRKGDELTMYGSLINPFLREDKNTRRIWDRINTKLDIIDESPKLYSDKILPPSSRYYLETFENCQQKSLYVYSLTKKQEPITLQAHFINEIDRHIKHVLNNLSESERDAYHFIKYNDEFIYVYLLFFGNTSRQLGNAAIKLTGFIDELNELSDQFNSDNNAKEKRELYLRKLYLVIFDFCSNILGMLALNNEEKYQTRKLLKDILTYREGSWGLYINYIYLKDYVEEKLKEGEEEKREQLYNQIVPIFILMYFIESMLIIENKANQGLFDKLRTRVHGQGVFIDVLDMFTSGKYSLVWKKQSDDFKEFLWFYGTLIDSPNVLMDFDPVEVRKIRAYFQCLPNADNSIQNNIRTYDRENPRWFRTLAFILYASYEGIYNLKKSDILLRRLNQKSSEYWDRTVRNELQNSELYLIDVLSKLPGSILLSRYVDRLNKVQFIDLFAEVKSKLDGSSTSIGSIRAILKDMLGENYSSVCTCFIKRTSRLPRIARWTKDLSIYMSGMQTSIDMIEEILNSFSTYKIMSFDTFIGKINALEVDYSYQMMVDLSTAIDTYDRDKNVAIIERALLFRIMRTALDEVSRSVDSIDYSTLNDQEELVESDNIFLSMIDQIECYITTDTDIENAVRLLALFQYFNNMQKLYFQTYLILKKDSATDLRIDTSILPYETLYVEIRKHLAKPSGVLSNRINGYVREGIAGFLDYLNRE